MYMKTEQNLVNHDVNKVLTQNLTMWDNGEVFVMF